jgi:polyisoprenoid-binding protein YceI
MKTRISMIALIAAFVTLSAFNGPAPVKYQVDTKASTLLWTASKVTGSHSGTVPIKNGEIVFDGKTIKEGRFDLDLSSLTVTDITDAQSNANLVGHLKDKDFFNTATYPTASFVINSVTAKSGDDFVVKGKLTIKGITKDIEFPATVKQQGKKVTATAKITVNRTQFDIRYGSKSFFNDLGDKAIDDEFQLDLKLVANS